MTDAVATAMAGVPGRAYRGRGIAIRVLEKSGFARDGERDGEEFVMRVG